MSSATLGPASLSHCHVFLGAGHEKNERRMWAVIALGGAMTTAEIIGGLILALSPLWPAACT
jgi:Co/Zn/Cd efflux system component